MPASPTTNQLTDRTPASDQNGTGHLLYRLDASIRVEGSHSRAIADIVEREWRNAHPDEPIVRRHVGVEPIPATAWATAVFAGQTPEESRSDEQKAALALATTLTDELVAADALLLAAPDLQATDFSPPANSIQEAVSHESRTHRCNRVRRVSHTR